VSYGEMAAARATSVYAYGEAVRLLEQAIKVQEILDPEDNVKRCDLLLALGDALILAGELLRILNAVAPAALTLAEAIVDEARASRICQMALLAIVYYGLEMLGAPEAAEWAVRANRYAKPDTIARVWADAMAGSVRCGAGRFREGVRLLTNALRLSRKLGNTDSFWIASCMWLGYVYSPLHFTERLHLAEELSQGSRAGVRMQTNCS